MDITVTDDVPSGDYLHAVIDDSTRIHSRALDTYESLYTDMDEYENSATNHLPAAHTPDLLPRAYGVRHADTGVASERANDVEIPSRHAKLCRGSNWVGSTVKFTFATAVAACVLAVWLDVKRETRAPLNVWGGRAVQFPL